MNQLRRRLILSTAAFTMGLSKFGNSDDRVPRVQLNVGDFGGVPGAPPQSLISAFTSSLAKLRKLGGGELLVPPGVYDFGLIHSSSNIVQAHNLKNVHVSAYGATFIMTSADTGTSGKLGVRPFLFYFNNPSNVTLAGASFYDYGFKPMLWQGMFAVHAGASVASSGFTMLDCAGENVCGLFLAIDEKKLLRNVHISGRVKNSYYGVSMHNVGDDIKVDLVCQDVRRGAILYGVVGADISIKLDCHDNFYGSNGFICLCSNGASAGDTKKIVVKLDVTGVESHKALVHFYHQEAEMYGCICDVDATAIVNVTEKGKNADVGKTNVFLFSHEYANGFITPITARSWNNISLRGEIRSPLSGSVISVPSRSTSTGTVRIDHSLAALIDMSSLPKQFTT